MIEKIKHRLISEFRRLKNAKVAYKYPECAINWEKYGSPIIGSNEAGIFFDPYVAKYGSEFIMFSSLRNKQCIVKTISEDGVSWSEPQSILEPITLSWQQKVNRASFMIKDNLWYMWYTGMDDSSAAIGFAMSLDGKEFERVGETPVLCPTLPFEQNAVMNPCVIWDSEEKVFKMWYSAGEKYEPDVICYAISINGKTWNKYEKPVMEKGANPYDQYKVGGCDVHKTKNGSYVMYYIGYQNLDVARICRATSKNGIDWIRDENNPVLSPSKGSWDSDAVYKPAVYYDEKDKEQLIWYNGRRKCREYIGVAIHRG